MRRLIIILGLWGALFATARFEAPRLNPTGPTGVYEANGGCTDPFGAPRPCS